MMVLLGTSFAADPREEAYWRTFYLTPIGAWGAEDPVPSINGNAPYPLGIGNVTEYRDSMLLLTGGEEPLNLRIGISNQTQFLSSTQGVYYDWLYEPNPISDLAGLIEQSLKFDVPMGVHLNGTPWADTPNQSVDTLLNHLEILESGRYLARDRNGNFRRGVQDPTIDESYDDFAPQLEMQLSLSRYAEPVREYLARNLRMSARVLAWYREQHPDLIIYNSASSEYAQHTLDNEWFDYSEWSRQEFRDWLSGDGDYTGQEKYASLEDFNSQFTGGNFLNPTPPGFPFASWDAVEPPTDPNWTASQRRGQWWLLWQEFRIHQVASMVQFHQDQVIVAGWSPDRTYGHQIPFNPASTNNTVRRYATPWTTTFTHSSSNGITTYETNAASNTIFSAMYANDRNWGIFEYNRLSDSVSLNRDAIDATWNNHIHVLTPYAWGGQETYRIQGGSAFEIALREFIFDNRNNRYTGLQRWEAHPDSRDIVWSMSRNTHIGDTHDMVNAQFDTGIYSAEISGIDPYLWLNVDPANPLETRELTALSFRLHLEEPIEGSGQLFWMDADDALHSLDFSPLRGWHVYQVNLAHNLEWNAHQAKALRLDIPGVGGSTFSLDWVRLHATHAWEFMNPLEIYSVTNITDLTVSNGMVSGLTTSDDPYFYFATDKSDPAVDADRVFIDARTHSEIRFTMTTSAAGTGELFWWRRDDPTPNLFQFPVESGTHTYNLDMSNVPGWEGQVTRLRLDPVSVPSATFAVGHFSIHPRMVTPRPTYLESISNTRTPHFGWDRPEEAPLTGIVYDFQLARDWDFEDLVLDVPGLDADHFIHEGTELLDGLYYWRVRARSTEGLVSPWSVPMHRFIRVWDMTRTDDLIMLNHFDTPVVEDGIWQAVTNDADPYFFFNSGGNHGGVIDTERYRSLKLRIRLEGPGQPLDAELFCFPQSGGFFVYPFSIPSDGTWQEIEIDLTSNPQWTGLIQHLRLDPCAIPGVTVSLDRAELVPASYQEPLPDDIIWPFDTPGDFLGWTLDNDLDNGTVSNGLLQANVTGPDPFLVSPPFSPRPGSEFPFFLVRMRNTTEDGTAQLFWQTADEPFFTAERSRTFAVTTEDTSLREYVLDMEGVAEWDSEMITRLRFDPVSGFNPGATLIMIDEMSLTRENPASPSLITDWWMIH